MQTRRDQLQAYRFLTRRALAALVTGEPNAAEPPMRRLTITTVSGTMIAILIAVGFLLLGVLKPSPGDSWKDAGTIVVERETGARYVYLDGALHPVLNYSSAVLAVSGQGGGTAHVTLVSRSDLKHARRGATIGIDGIPDSLPPAGNLVHGPFSVCSRERPAEPSGLSVRVQVNVGSGAAATRLPATSAVLASSADGNAHYLLWQGSRLAIGSPDVLTALGLGNTAPVAVGTAFLDALAPGTALRTPDVAGLGEAVSEGGRSLVVGQLLETGPSGPYWVALPDGIASVTRVQAQLLQTLTLPDHTHLQPVQTTEADVLDMTQSRTGWAALKSQFDGLPATLPAISSGPAQNGGLCAEFTAGSASPAFAAPPSQLDGAQPGPASESADSRRGTADAVQLQPGSARWRSPRTGRAPCSSSPSRAASTPPRRRRRWPASGTGRSARCSCRPNCSA